MRGPKMERKEEAWGRKGTEEEGKERETPKDPLHSELVCNGNEYFLSKMDTFPPKMNILLPNCKRTWYGNRTEQNGTEWNGREDPESSSIILRAHLNWK